MMHHAQRSCKCNSSAGFSSINEDGGYCVKIYELPEDETVVEMPDFSTMTPKYVGVSLQFCVRNACLHTSLAHVKATVEHRVDNRAPCMETTRVTRLFAIIS